MAKSTAALTIAAAAGSSVGSKHVVARSIEKAMAQAVADCGREGITDPGEILKRKLAAREQIKRA